MAGKRFTTTSRKQALENAGTASDGRVLIPFEVDDDTLPGGVRECLAYLPTKEQAAFVTRLASKYVSKAEKISGVLGFMDDVLENDTGAYLAGRLRENPPTFAFEQMVDLLVWLAEQFKQHALAEQDAEGPIRPDAPNRAERRAGAVAVADQPILANRYVSDETTRQISVAELAARAGVDPGLVVPASSLPSPPTKAAPRRAAAKKAPAKAAPAKKVARPAKRQVRP